VNLSRSTKRKRRRKFEEERNKDGAGEEANDASYLIETRQGENESEKATAASKPCDDDNANPRDQTRV
jgi:transposase-like protein